MKPIALCAAFAVAAALPAAAHACGCFTIPSPANPVVQAGERILFAHEGNNVVAYIQIKYQGAADDFGWIVPLPSVPTLQIGTDELFGMLDRTTAPQYLLTTTQQYCGGGESSSVSDSGGGCGATFSAADQGVALDMAAFAAPDGGAGPNVAVEQASIGPYDYAVLKADDESAMLQWLQDNHYFVPANTMNAVKPYIQPGQYFLALKLRAGQTAGDIQPIVLSYQSDLPMIPITLTSVGAIDDMGVLVWILGDSRAIPRNYYDVVVDDMPVWFGTKAFDLQLIDAVHEAPGKHGFITQYAGPSSLIAGQLALPGRYDGVNQLYKITLPSQYIQYLQSAGYPFAGTMLSILMRYIPEPPSLISAGISPGQFYAQFDYYSNMTGLASTDPDGGAYTFDPKGLTNEIIQRIVMPDQQAEQLIGRHPYLTRMYTALSPVDMTIDPVFSFNADLPPVPLNHTATLTIPCAGDPWLHSDDQGFEAQYPGGQPPSVALPASLRVQLLRDAGPAAVVQDNSHAIAAALGPVTHGLPYTPENAVDGGYGGGGCGCKIAGGRMRSNVAMLFVVAGCFLILRRARRRRR